MNQHLHNLLKAVERPAYLLASIGIIFAASSGVVLAAAAGGQVQSRSIMMSDSGVSGGSITTGVGSGTGVTYRVTFKAATSYTIKGIVLDFCAGSNGTPFIGDATCDDPTGFSVGTTPTIDTSDYIVGPVGSTVTTNGIGSSWTASSTSPYQTVKLTNTSGTALTAGTTYTFAVSGITNPSTLGTFYARLITYTSNTGDITAYDHGTPGTYQDYGGFALSTANVVQVTAKVQETLTFCVSGSVSSSDLTSPYTTTGPDCANSTVPAITLGHGTNKTLDASAVDTAPVYTLASTNALNGVAIRMHNSNACGGLSTDSGTSCLIPAVNGGAATIGDLPAGNATGGTAAFGMRCDGGTAVATGAAGTVPCDANYFDSTHATYYSMDTASVGQNVTSTYGDVIAGSSAPVNLIENHLEFAATASNTTPAGIYKANMSLIATGTF